MSKFLKSLICFTLIFLILTQPCFALGPVSITPVATPVLSPTNFTVKTELLNKPFYSHLLHKSLVNACSKIGEGLNSQTAFGLCFTSLSLRKASAHLTYDGLNRLTKLTNTAYNLKDLSLDSGQGNPPQQRLPYSLARPISQFDYSYDDVGNRLSMTTLQGADNYGYDPVYQLTSVSGNQAHNYDYDTVGNREIVDGTIYTTNNLNQYTDVGGTAYQSDPNGNLISDGVNTYTYDYENRLKTAITPTNNATYEYDGLGRRISKTVNGTTTYFIYDADQIIEERNPTGTLLKSYIFGSGIDEILRYTNYQQQTTNYYYHYDGLGSVSDITNASNEVVESYSYDVYGTPSQLSTIGNRFYFTGRELDQETGIYYYRNRYYSPSIGRFLQRDPITWGPDDPRLNNQINLQTSTLLLAAFWENLGIKDVRRFTHDQQLKNILGVSTLSSQLLHPYTYCLNSPTNFIDPQGKWIWLLSGLVGAGIAMFIEAGNEDFTIGSLTAAGATGFIGGVLAPFFAGSAVAAMSWGAGVGAVKYIATTWARGESICISKAITSATISGIGAGWGYGVGSLADNSVLGMLLGANVRLWWGDL